MRFGCVSQLIVHFHAEFVHRSLLCIPEPELVELTRVLLDLSDGIVLPPEQHRGWDRRWLSLQQTSMDDRRDKKNIFAFRFNIA